MNKLFIQHEREVFEREKQIVRTNPDSFQPTPLLKRRHSQTQDHHSLATAFQTAPTLGPVTLESDTAVDALNQGKLNNVFNALM